MRPASINELHRASGVLVMTRRVASLSRPDLPQYRVVDFGVTSRRLVSLIHTFGGPPEPFSRVNRASEVRVIRMSLALPAFGQKAAMESKLAGFGRSFCADTNAMIGKKLTCEGGRPRRRFSFYLATPVQPTYGACADMITRSGVWWHARIGPRCAPKCPFGCTGWSPCWCLSSAR